MVGAAFEMNFKEGFQYIKEEEGRGIQTKAQAWVRAQKIGKKQRVV